MPATRSGFSAAPRSAGVDFAPWSLEDPGRVPSGDALVHLAFDHLPEVFRGGEGDDPERFHRLNHQGSVALFEAARRAGIARVIFMSSRAVYGDNRRGEILRETDAPAPDSLYGELKLASERALLERAAPSFAAAAIRATGVYGRPPGADRHKWSGLFADHLAGRTVRPRCATEVHGSDLAAAVCLLLAVPVPQLGDGVFNASDILLDRHDLLAGLGARTGSPHAPPPRANAPPPGTMACGRLTALGWRPGGMERLNEFLDAEADNSAEAETRLPIIKPA